MDLAALARAYAAITGASSKAQPTPPEPMRDDPWNDPSLIPPRQQPALPSPSPSPSPEPSSDPIAEAQRLLEQREIVKKLTGPWAKAFSGDR